MTTDQRRGNDPPRGTPLPHGANRSGGGGAGCNNTGVAGTGGNGARGQITVTQD